MKGNVLPVKRRPEGSGTGGSDWSVRVILNAFKW